MWVRSLALLSRLKEPVFPYAVDVTSKKKKKKCEAEITNSYLTEKDYKILYKITFPSLKTRSKQTTDSCYAHLSPWSCEF